MNEVLDSTNPDNAEVIDDAYVARICAIVETVTVQSYGVPRDVLRSIVRRNKLPGATGLPERRVVEAGLVLLATSLKVKMLSENTVTKDPIGWAMCKWVDLSA